MSDSNTPGRIGPDAPDYGSRTNPVGSGVDIGHAPTREYREALHAGQAGQWPKDKPKFENLKTTFAGGQCEARVFGPGERLYRLTATNGKADRQFWVTEPEYNRVRGHCARHGIAQEDGFRNSLALKEGWQVNLDQTHRLDVPQDKYVLGHVGKTAHVTGGYDLYNHDDPARGIRAGARRNPVHSTSWGGGGEQVLIADDIQLTEWQRQGHIKSTHTPRPHTLSQRMGTAPTQQPQVANQPTPPASKPKTTNSRSPQSRPRKHIPRKGARYGIDVQKGRGRRVEQPRETSRLPKSHAARAEKSTNPTKRQTSKRKLTPKL